MHSVLVLFEDGHAYPLRKETTYRPAKSFGRWAISYSHLFQQSNWLERDELTPFPITKLFARFDPKNYGHGIPRASGPIPYSHLGLASLSDPSRSFTRQKGLGWIRMSGNPNYPYSYPLKTQIWISVFVFVFNMVVRWMYSNSILNIIRIRHYPTKIRHIRHYSYPNKIKYP
jgi:hypothetical protein